MNIEASKRVQSIGGYAFAEVDKEVAKLKALGVEPIDFGVGDPSSPTPELIREACKSGLDARARAGYPSYIGAPEFRAEAAAWMQRRFGVALDPETQISSSSGSKEAVFHLHEGFVDPGDVVIVPTPGYPPYSRGTLFAEGTPYYLPLTEENGFLPDLAAIPAEVASAAKMLWINYPNSPTGRIAPDSFFEDVIRFGHDNDILIASDEAYSEIYFDGTPKSILNFTTEGVIAIFSLSKRSAMTCYRVGWVAGNERAIAIVKKVKTNIDSGTPTFVQDAAIAALRDETHVDTMREEYKQKRDIMIAALTDAGLPACSPEATLYIWQKVPKGMTSVEFATRLLDPAIAVVTTPGSWISDETADGQNPGEGYIRFALVPSLEQTQLAADRIRTMTW